MVTLGIPGAGAMNKEGLADAGLCDWTPVAVKAVGEVKTLSDVVVVPTSGDGGIGRTSRTINGDWGASPLALWPC